MSDEYLLYQTLLGVWPLTAETSEKSLTALEARIQAYMLKAVPEAKVHSSWLNPNTDYENVLKEFIQGLLDSSQANAFLADFLPFQRRVAGFGLLNALSQTLLKLTAPGVPDIYQGNELWGFSLVDPDNRRPVDYVLRHKLLQEIKCGNALPGRDGLACLHELFSKLPDGRAKLCVIWQALALRRTHPLLFEQRGLPCL